MKKTNKKPEVFFWLAEEGHRPFIHTRGKDRRTFPRVTTAFYRILELIYPRVEFSLRRFNFSDCPLIPNVGEFYPRGLDASLHTAPPEVQHALSSLYCEIQNAVDRAYHLGVEHGRDHLRGLAAGEITVDEFNRVGTVSASETPKIGEKSSCNPTPGE